MKHTLKVYKDTTLHTEYMKARFPHGQSRPTSFWLEGHRWAYEASSFDDAGDYDRLYRFTDDDIEIPDNTDLRDTFAAAALIGLTSNRSMIDVLGSESITYVAEGAWKLADAMLRVRGQ